MKPSLRFLLLLLGTSLPGFVLGLWMTSAFTNGSSVRSPPIAQNSRSPEYLDQLRRENLMAAVEGARGHGGAEADTDDIQRFLDEVDASDMRVVPVDSLRNLNIKAIEGGAVTDEMQDILSLSPEEVERVNCIIRETGERLGEAELERMQAVETSKTKMVLHIPALGDAGQQLAADFREELKKTLGATDGNVFLTVMADDHISYWDAFGSFDRTVTFSVEPRGDRIWVQFEQESPVEQIEAYYHARGVRHIGNGMGRGFGTTYPYPWGQSPPRRSLQRSKFLLPLLPEELRFYFEEVEKGR